MLALYLKNCKELLFIHHPFESKVNEPSFYQIFKKGEKTSEKKIGKTHKQFFSFLKDFLVILYVVFKQKSQYDIFFGIDPLNAFAGLVLKKLKKVRVVIFYPIDYSPIRFKNKFLNWVYHRIETTCAKNCDYVWVLVQKHMDLFVTKGADKKKFCLTPVQVEKIYYSNSDKIKNPIISYIGTLRPEKGIELIIDCIPLTLKKIPHVKFLFIGGGPLEEYLRSKIKENNCEKSVQILGHVPSREDAMSKLSESTIGLAPYVVKEGLYTSFGYGAKILEYMSCGMPVIATHWKKIEEDGIGLTINYDANELANAIEHILLDENLYNRCRAKSYEKIKDHHYEEVFGNAFESIGIQKNSI